MTKGQISYTQTWTQAEVSREIILDKLIAPDLQIGAESSSGKTTQIWSFFSESGPSVPATEE